MNKTIITLLLTVLVLAGCKQDKEPSDSGSGISVAVTILPYADIVKRIGGGTVNVTTLIPPGTIPETYEPSFNRLADISSAELYIRVGSFFAEENPWITKLAEFNQDIKIVNSAEGVELIDNNPHVWLGIKEIKIIAGNIKNALSSADYEHKETYEKNYDHFVMQLTETADSIKESLSGKKHRTMLVYHPAWTYLCRSFGLEQLAIEGHGHEASPKELKHLIETAKQKNVKVLFLQKQITEGASRAVAKEIGAEIVHINPLPNNYIDNLMDIGDKLSIYLN